MMHEGQAVEVLMQSTPDEAPWQSGFVFVRATDDGTIIVRATGGALSEWTHDRVRAEPGDAVPALALFDVQVWLRDRPNEGLPGVWIVAHAKVSQFEAIGLSAEASRKGERSRIMIAGTDVWAQCFEVLSGPGRVLEAVFWCELDAQRYVENSLRELGVVRCFTRQLWRASVDNDATVCGRLTHMRGA